MYHFPHLEDRLSNLHDSWFERQNDVGIVRSQFNLHKTPNSVGQLHWLVDHVLPLQCPFGNSESLKIDNRYKLYSLVTVLNITKTTLFFCILCLIHMKRLMTCYLNWRGQLVFIKNTRMLLSSSFKVASVSNSHLSLHVF